MSPDRFQPKSEGEGSPEGSQNEAPKGAIARARVTDPLGYTIANVSFAIAELAAVASDLALAELGGVDAGVCLARARTGVAAVADALQEVRHGADRVRHLLRDLQSTARGPEDGIAGPIARSPSGGVIPDPNAPAPASLIAKHPTAASSVLRGKVLVVDDEPMMVRAILRLLEGEHDVVSATDAVDVVARIAEGARYDAILCDLMMPVMSGMQAYDEIRRVAPDQARRIVFMTGGAFTPPVFQFLQSVENLRIEKPLERAALRAIIRAQLTRGA